MAVRHASSPSTGGYSSTKSTQLSTLWPKDDVDVFMQSRVELSTTASSISFQNIPQTYKLLWLHVEARSSNSGNTIDLLQMNINGYTNVESYRSDLIIGDLTEETTASYSSLGYLVGGIVAGSTFTANCFGFSVIEIPNYTYTRNNNYGNMNVGVKTIGVSSGVSGSSSGRVQEAACYFMQFEPVVQISLSIPGGFLFSAGTTATLYLVDDSEDLKLLNVENQLDRLWP